MSRKITQKEFVARCQYRMPEYTPLGEYKGRTEKVLFRHECGNEFMMSPSHFWRGEGCPICANKNRNEHSRAENEQKIYQAVAKAGLSLPADFVYTNNKQKIEVTCVKCGHKQVSWAISILRGASCKHCEATKKLPLNDFLEKLHAKAPEWELVGEYHGCLEQTAFKHLKCGNITVKKPTNLFLNPTSCKFCAAERLRKPKPPKGPRKPTKVPMSHNEFLEKVADRLNEYDIISEYKGAHQPITVRHKVCGREITMPADNFARGSRCKSCKYSTGEGKVYDYIASIVGEDRVVQGDRTHLIDTRNNTRPVPREIDILVEDANIGFEYDGLWHHSSGIMLRKHPTWSQAKADGDILWKTKECAKQGIRLIHIFEDEWVHHEDIVKDKIDSLFHIEKESVYARTLEVKQVTKVETRPFLEANHIQGEASYTVAYGLYRGKELLAVQEFLQTEAGRWELVRYATKLGTRVVGGFSKCLKTFERENHPVYLKSFADLRWTDPKSNVYLSCGFIEAAVNRPTYWYIQKNMRVHKKLYRKDSIKKKLPQFYDPTKTERQMTEAANIHRIYDCGNIRYEKHYES